jgi:hypothetical protein
MISTRFLAVVGILFALALLPTLIHSYSTSAIVDGLSTAAIPPTLAGYSSAPSGRGPNWGRQRFDSDDWMERNYRSGSDDVRLTVVRSFDLKSLYHHPELAVAYGQRFGSSFDEHEVKRFADRPDVPVHVLHPAPPSRAVAMYVLHYGNEFVEDPIWFQLRTAGALLVSARKPMTLFFVHDLSVESQQRLEDLASRQLLLAALNSFLASPTTSGR